MNYTSFIFKAVVDWIELEVRTTAKTQAWRIHEAMKGAASFVTGHDEETGIVLAGHEANTPTTLFRFRVQDPKNFQAVKALTALLSRECSLTCPLQLTAIEIAFDTYRKGATRRQLAEIVTDRYRFSTRIPGGNWHFYRGKGEKPRDLDGRDYAGEMNRREIIQHLESSWQLADTNKKSADIRIHGYVKTWDNGEDLPKEEWRARFEITLRGAALPCQTLDELAGIDFARLAGHFKFRQLAHDLHPAARYALAQWSGKQFGRCGKYRRRHRHLVGKYSGSSVFRSSTVADERLNEAAYECLRKLTREWRSKRASADFPEHLEEGTRMGAGSMSSLLMIGLNNTINTDSTNASSDYDDQGKEAQRADCPTNTSIELDSLLSSPLTRNFAADEAQRADVAPINDMLMFSLTPELEAEQKRIDDLMGFGPN